MDQEPEGEGQQAASPQVSQWLFTVSRRRRVRAIGAIALVIVLVALVAVGLLALSSAFFPQ